MEKLESRSQDDSVHVSMIMPAWFDNLDEERKRNIRKSLQGYCFILEDMIQSERAFWTISSAMVQGIVDELGTVMDEIIRGRKKK